MVGIKTPNAQQTCPGAVYDGVCFPDGDRSFADSSISYDPGTGVEGCCNKPTSAEGSPDYQYDKDGSYVSLGCDGVLVVKFTDNSLTTSGDSDADLWIFEIGAEIEPTYIDISTNGVNWIQVGSTSGATSGIDIDSYIGDGVILDVLYSYVRITDRYCLSQDPPYPGADIDAVGAIESAPPVTTTTTTSTEPTTTIPPETTTTVNECPSGSCISSGECTDIYGTGWACISGCCEQVPITTTTTTPADTTTTTTEDYCYSGEILCGDGHCCDKLSSLCCIDECCSRRDDVCTLAGCVPCSASELYGENSYEVVVLRDFRDNVLSQTPVGQEIIELYYLWSPAIAKAMEEDEAYKEEVKEMIDGVLEMIE